MGMEKCAFALPRGAMVRFFDESGNREITQGLFIGPEDNSDFVAVPLTDETLLSSRVGDRVRVRYGYLGAMAEFCSELIEIIQKPVLMWRIQAPREVNRFEQRGHPRIQCSVSAAIDVLDKGFFLKTIIRDISKSGARCAILEPAGNPNPLAVEDAVTLRCTFPGIVGEQTAAGNIAEVDLTAGELSIGIHFTEPQAWVPPYR